MRGRGSYRHPIPDDDQNPAFPLTLTDGGTWKYSEKYTCSTNPDDYAAGAGRYTFSEDTLAIVTSGGLEEDRDSATETVNSYGPAISKTAAGSYDERHEWDVVKTVSPAGQSGFAGDTLPFTWTITVTESVFEENFDSRGDDHGQEPGSDGDGGRARGRPE